MRRISLEKNRLANLNSGSLLMTIANVRCLARIQKPNAHVYSYLVGRIWS